MKWVNAYCPLCGKPAGRIRPSANLRAFEYLHHYKRSVGGELKPDTDYYVATEPAHPEMPARCWSGHALRVRPDEICASLQSGETRIVLTDARGEP